MRCLRGQAKDVGTPNKEEARKKSRESSAGHRAGMGADEKARVREKDRDSHTRARDAETAEERSRRLAADRDRHRAAYALRNERREQERERYIAALAEDDGARAEGWRGRAGESLDQLPVMG